ncbi:MAG: hypothetical protein ACXAC5_21245 [Promethearchaeota archaeon]
MSRKKFNYSIIISIFIFNLIFINSSMIIASSFAKPKINTHIHLSGEIFGQEEWIKNSNFSSQDFWFTEFEGDDTDVDGIISGEQANFKIIGEHWIFSNVSGTPNATDWIPTKRPGDSIFPDLFEINQYGCNATHEYWEQSSLNRFGVMGNQTRNRPSVLWKRLITLPYDMDDYAITAAEISAIFNGSANTNVETPLDNLTGTNPTAAEYDHVKFYIQLSDMASILRYQVADYRPLNLGFGDLSGTDNQEWHGTENNVSDTSMTPVPEDVLIFYLTRVLESDNHNFTIFLGIDIDVEDNYGDLDRDTYYYLLIKSCNLTFDYEKKIDRFTSISWNQNGDPISNLSEYPVLVENATLSFKYKVDKLWNSSLSPNSEIRILINDNKHTETIKLSSATTSFQDGKVDGFDVSNLVSDDVNLSVQVYLADDFILDNNITVSIDDVSLDISYIILEPDEPIEPGPDMSWLVYTLIGAVIGIVTIIGLYLGHFKNPPMVRKIRKLKKKVRKAKKMKPILVSKREESIRKNYDVHKSILGLEITELKKIEKIPIRKEEKN